MCIGGFNTFIYNNLSLKKVILLGYMGSGKSSVGRVLAEKLAMNGFDLDKLIEESQQKTISDIFSEKGEIYFRKIESQILREFLDNQDSFVLALGGGTPCYANNHELLQRDDVISVYLKTSVDTLVQRLKKEKNTRPLIAHLPDEELKDYINKHLFDRNFYYHQAKYIINTDNKTVNEVVNEISEIIRKSPDF